MKLLLLLLIAVNCKGQIKKNEAPTLIKNGFSFSSGKIDTLYRFIIYGENRKSPAAYLSKDSVLVVNDSLETINVLIRTAIMTGEQMKGLAEENNRLRNQIKQMKGDKAVYATINRKPARVR